MIIFGNSEFGKRIQHLEAAMPAYTDTEFKGICDAVWTEPPDKTKHPTLFAEDCCLHPESIWTHLELCHVPSMAFITYR